jgi:hypothetical protein
VLLYDESMLKVELESSDESSNSEDEDANS